MKCVKLSLVICMTIALMIISAIAGNMVPLLGTLTSFATLGLWIWWIVGFFTQCDDVYGLTGVVSR